MAQAVSAPGRAVLGLTGFIVLNLLVTFCIKESGTNVEHTWLFFWLACVFGPLSVVFLMWFYGSMNPNLAAALAMGISSGSIQVGFWLVYHASLTPSQWLGIALVTVGGVVCVSGPTSGTQPGPAGAGARTEPAE